MLAARAAVVLEEQAGVVGDLAHLLARVENEPTDHQARYDLAVALNAAGRRDAAAQELLNLVKRDRAWNDEAARKLLLQLFESWGPLDPGDALGAQAIVLASVFVIGQAMAMNKTYLRASDLPEAIPLFPLTGAILLPGGQLPLNIFEPRYLAMFDDAMRGERIIGMIQPASGVDPSPGETSSLRAVGAAGRITQLSETGDGRYFVVLSGIARFRLVAEIDAATPYRQARVDFESFSEDFTPEDRMSPACRDDLNVIAFDLAQALKLDIARKDIEAMPDFDMVAVFAMIGPFDPAEKQALLEAKDLAARADLLLALAEVALARATRADRPLQ